MERGSTLILRAAVLAIGAGVLALCIFALPAGISSDQTGYYRPILLGLYVPAIPFFVALYQSLRLLSYIDRNKAFSELSVKSLQIIKHCAVIISGLFALGMPYIFTAGDQDDAPGVIALGLIIVGASLTIAVFAAILQRLLHQALAIKTENDLTV